MRDMRTIPVASNPLLPHIQAMITNVNDLVNALGGQHELAKLLGITPDGVMNAVRRKKVPTTWHMRIYRQARRLKIKIDPDLLVVKRNRA